MADFYKWDPVQLTTHVHEMDDEHVILIRKMNALHEAYVQRQNRESLELLLSDFAAFTVSHFTDEEAYMEKIGFAGVITHKIIHQQLLAKVQSYVEEFKKTGNLTDDFFDFLSIWLTSHIQGIDIKYGQHKAA